MKTINLIRQQIEVACVKNNRSSYKWMHGYFVVNPETGNKIYPAVPKSEAVNLARQLYGADCKVIVI